MRALFIVRDLEGAEPIGLMQLASLLQRDGHTVELVGARTQPLAMLFQPYPGTTLGDRAVKEGHFDGDFDALDYNYYEGSRLRYESERARFATENLQKLFALLVEAPWLEPLARRILPHEPNMILRSVFRAWYIYCYTRRIIPHSLDREEAWELLRSLFGMFPPEVNHELLEKD